MIAMLRALVGVAFLFAFSIVYIFVVAGLGGGFWSRDAWLEWRERPVEMIVAMVELAAILTLGVVLVGPGPGDGP